MIDDMGSIQRERELMARMAPELERALWEVVRDESLEVKKRIKAEMPVDTGAAQSRWGEQSQAGQRMNTSGTPEDPARFDAGIWREDRRHLAIEQGAWLLPYEYIQALNEGHSQQAPPGFIDRLEERAVDRMKGKVLLAFTRAWRANRVFRKGRR